MFSIKGGSYLFLPKKVFISTSGVEYLKEKGANIVSIQIPELEETRTAHGITISTEMVSSIDSKHPNELEQLVRSYAMSTMLVKQTKLPEILPQESYCNERTWNQE